MKMRKSVALGEILQDPLGAIDEALSVRDLRIVRHRPVVVEDENRQRLMLLAKQLDDPGAWLFERQSMHLDLRGEPRKRAEQPFDRIAMRAYEESPGTLWIPESRTQ